MFAGHFHLLLYSLIFLTMKLTTGSLTLMEIHIWNPSEKMVVKEQVRQMRERERERERESKLTFGVQLLLNIYNIRNNKI